MIRPGPGVFLDRDGVLNALVLNPRTGAYESPHRVEDLRVLPEVPRALSLLLGAGYPLFLVSNQPSYAKGKTPLEQIHAIRDRLERELEGAGIRFRQTFYCFHHPDGIVPGYSGPCECRKPKPFFVLQAAAAFHLDLGGCWFIGDEGTDIACGKAAGCRTILVEQPLSAHRRGQSRPDFTAPDLLRAAHIVLTLQAKEGAEPCVRSR